MLSLRLRLFCLNLHVGCNSPVRSTKSTPSHISRLSSGSSRQVCMYFFWVFLFLDPKALLSPRRLTSDDLRLNSAPTVCRHTVSGSFSLPSRGAFHLSLTVLVLYRSLWVFSLGGWSPRIPTGFLVSRGTWDPLCNVRPFAYRCVTFCAAPFQVSSTRTGHYVSRVPQPQKTEVLWFRLAPFRSPLLGGSMFLSLPPGT